MSLGGGEDSSLYRSLEVLTFEEWIKEYTQFADSRIRLRSVYEEEFGRLDSDENLQELEMLDDAISYNKDVLRRALLEKDYLVFYREDGTLSYQMVSPAERVRIYDREMAKRRMCV
jgi:hypothetical protein